jgi:hypothetical protein
MIALAVDSESVVMSIGSGSHARYQFDAEKTGAIATLFLGLFA